MKPKSRKQDIVVQEANGEVLIYDLRSDKAFCLNETSALVWNACDGSKDVNEIRQEVSRKLKKDAADDLIWLALDQLNEQKLMEAGTDSESPLAGLSRREVIKKIGLTSAIALPVVLSLVAPKAIMAQTTCIAGGSCTCSTPSTGQGQQCTTAPGGACANTACRCVYANNGNAQGTCVV